MWKKVVNKEQLSRLEVGDALIKHPMKGGIADTFDDADPENISPRVVTSNNGEQLLLSSLFSDRMNDPILGMYKSVFGPVDKSYDELIAERLWWVFEG